MLQKNSYKGGDAIKHSTLNDLHATLNTHTSQHSKSQMKTAPRKVLVTSEDKATNPAEDMSKRLNYLRTECTACTQ